MVDDILDVTQGSDVLGKTVGKDADQNKSIYVFVLGLDGVWRRADALHQRARAALERSEVADRHWLVMLADRVVERQS